jgi:glycosyltransferase involved in cell wall biosynthesis
VTENSGKDRGGVSGIPAMDDYRLRPGSPARKVGGRNAERNGLAARPGGVSVVTVCFNSIKTIDRTISSVAAQTYSPLEYVIVDGGSTDGTAERLAARSQDIDVWISERDAGISDAFNKGIALTSGEYVMLVNSDDWLEPEHITCAVNALRASGADFAFGDMLVHAPDGTKLYRLVGDKDYARRVHRFMPFINHPTVVCRRRVYEQHGLFDVSLRVAMDYDWLLRVHRKGVVGIYVPALVGHMSLEGASDRLFDRAAAEVRDVSICHGNPPPLAWWHFVYTVVKGRIRGFLQRYVPRKVYEGLRRAVNPSFNPLDR